MKKKFVTGNRVPVIFMTLASFMLFWQSTQSVYASADKQTAEEIETEKEAEGGEVFGEDEEAAEKRLKKVIPLDANKVTQISKYIVEKNATYVLDESSIVVEEIGRGSSEGADVVTVSKKVVDLSDNDLERIEKTIFHNGIICELLSVVYEVEKEDKNGIPIAYSAACEYGGLKKYSISYPSAWQMTAWYDLYGTAEDADIVAGHEEYKYIYVPEEQNTGSEEAAEREEETEIEENEKIEDAEEEEAPLPKPAVKKIEVKQVPEEKNRKKVPDILVPLAAAAAGTGAVIPCIVWFTIVTAPLFALKKEDKYRYIGRIRLRKEDGMYTAYLTKRLFARAEVPVFLIRLSGRVRKKTKSGMLQVHCPDGKKIILTVGKEVSFTVEGNDI